MFELFVENFADWVWQANFPSQNTGQHVSQSHHAQDQSGHKHTHTYAGAFSSSGRILKWSSDQLDTHPDSSTTGAWSKPFSLRILMVFWQVTVGRTVSGADRFRPCTFRFHHLEAEEQKFTKNPELREFHKYNCPLVLHVPWFVHHNVLFPQEALLNHPLVIQELRPDKSKQINMKFHWNFSRQVTYQHLTWLTLTTHLNLI